MGFDAKWCEAMKLTTTQAVTPFVTLNLAVTRSNLNNDSELILMIANIFVKDLPAKVLSLQSAFDRKDSNGVILHSHTIKGLASNFQAEPLTKLTRKLELEYLSLSEPELEMLISEIAMTSEHTIGALNDELELDLSKSSERCEDK